MKTRRSGLVDLLLDVHDESRTRKLALLVAVSLHLLLITVTFPSIMREPPKRQPQATPVRITSWVPQPPPLRAALPPASQIPLRARRIPVPDPGPEAPEPATEPTLEVADHHLTPSIPVELGEPEPPPSRASLFFRPGLDGVSFPMLLKGSQVLPEYPALARKAGVSGKVLLEAVVRADGSVGDVKVLQSPGANLGFEDVTMEAVRQWRYRPGMQNGRPVAVFFTIVVEFVLE
jgi:protein TonB